MSKYRVRSKHAIDLPDGRVAVPLQVVQLKDSDPITKALVSDGRLIRLKAQKRGSK